jgi:putative ABC transport system permease protein
MTTSTTGLTRLELVVAPRLPLSQLLWTALDAFRTRRVRAALSALGIAIGIGAMVAVVGVAASAQANLLAEIDALGTNLLTVSPGQSFLGTNHIGGHVMVYLGKRWFTVVGILRPVVLDSSLDSTVFISLPVAEQLFGTQPNPSEIYVRASQTDVTGVWNLLAATADPQDASGVNISRPSDTLEARAAAKGQFTTLLVGLGAVALLVGAIGIANIMVISVLERRGEIGLRRALGATRRHIATQFLTESAILAILRGLAGLTLGAGATWIYAATKHEPFIVRLYALLGAPAAGLLIGAVAGLYPASKAARLSPTEASRE